jgi:hypothetical protein
VNRSWSDAEVEAIVKDYFDMLAFELCGKEYNKSAHRRKLSPLLNSRSAGSIERKHQNISAILIEMGMPYISGYKPLRNYQRTVMPGAITDHVQANRELLDLLSNDANLTPEIPTVENILESIVSPPEPQEVKSEQIAEQRAIYTPSPIDYIAREAANRSLGSAGEDFVMNFERARLIEMGKTHLADRVEQVSVTEGDYVGYDIHSFERNGIDRFIEAKTTKYGIQTPFYITRNELNFSSSHRDRYYLYRVFEFRKNPLMFLLPGYLNDYCSLSPINYLARL